MKVSDWALKHPVPVAIITAGAVLFGLVALAFLNREFVPSIVTPTVSVVTLYPGVAAEDVERDVTMVLEDRLSSLTGLNSLKSESLEGVSVVRAQFRQDAGNILQEVRFRVEDAADDLPDDLASPPMVSAWGASDLPVFTFAVFGSADADRLTRYVEDVVVPDLFRVDGVADARILGGRKEELRITLDVDAMSVAGITPLDVYGAVRAGNTGLNSGLVDWNGGQWAFRVSGEFTGLDDIGGIVVGSGGNQPIRLADIATIEEEYAETEERIRSGGRDLVVVQVTKKEQGNALSVSRDIRDRLAGLEVDVSGDYRFIVTHDDSKTIRQSLGVVMDSALVGIAMAVAVIWLFLRSLRFTMVVAVSLPVSLVITFAGMKLTGQSINVLTLAGITVSLGMVVDASIVVLENIHRRHAGGDLPDIAASVGAGSVSGAVIASTTTSVSVFAPMMFLTGIVGSVMKDLSLTIVLCLTSSLFSALFIVPILARRGLVLSNIRLRPRGPMVRLEKFYSRILTKAIGVSRSVVIAALVILALSVLSAGMMGISFIPAADYDELFVSLELPPGASLETSARIADRAESHIRRLVPETVDILFFAGMESDLAGDARRREAVWGQVKLVPRKDRRRDFRAIIDALNDNLPPALPGVSVTVFNGGFDRMVSMGADGSGFRVELRSRSGEGFDEAAARIEAILAGDPNVVSVTRDVTTDRRFVEARLNRNLTGDLGITSADAAFTSRIAFEGTPAGEYRPDGGPNRDIRIVTTLDGRSPDGTTLGRIPVRSATGAVVSLDSLTTITDSAGASGIRRHDRSRAMTVIAYTRDENLRPITRRLKTELGTGGSVGGVEWRIEGIGGLVSDSLTSLAVVLGVALFLVYAVMAVQFERFLQPLVIMASVPFCFIGVVGGLALFGSTLSLISFLGIVALAGIVVNNAIVQVDRINQLRQDGLPLKDAVVQGSVTRLRPILMTTLTTFFGVLPLSLAGGSGARIYAPLGQAIAGGLVSSTLVTLILIPTLYAMLARREESRAGGEKPLVQEGAA